jgi:hypothetical protein
MKPRHVVALVFGCLLVLLGLGMVIGGGAVGVFELVARDDGGWHSVAINRLESSGVAVTTEDTMARIEGPTSVFEGLDMQMRLQVTSADPSNAVFVGVGPAADVAAYLSGAAHDNVTRVNASGVPTYRFVPGADTVAAPASQTFWDSSATGSGTHELTWTLKPGSWTVAVLNASGASPVAVSAVAGVRVGSLLPIAATTFVIGLLALAGGTLLIVAATRGRSRSYGPPPDGIPTPAAAGADASSEAVPTPDRPVVLEARLAPDLSRWLWLVKWFLAIPHYVVLALLWAAFVVTTMCAWFAILVTARYPRSLFDVNVGVLRWTWRVAHYVGPGGMGTDRYPPFTLGALPDDDARLDIAYPERLSRGLIFVKWLLLLPHWIVVALIAGTQSRTDQNGVTWGGWPGLLGILAFVAGVVLLVSGTYAAGLFDVIVGLNRWVFRVIAYGALMTDVYPPFRYDGGGREPAVPALPPPVGPPVAGAAPVPPPSVLPPPVLPPPVLPPPVPPDAVPPDAVPPDAEPSRPESWHHTTSG